MSTENAVEKEKNHKIMSLNESLDHIDLIDVDYIAEISKNLECCVYHQFFQSNNQLHKHLQMRCHHSKIITKSDATQYSDSNSKFLIMTSIYVRFTAMNHLSSEDYEF